jgi:hypothetical protein
MGTTVPRDLGLLIVVGLVEVSFTIGVAYLALKIFSPPPGIASRRSWGQVIAAVSMTAAFACVAAMALLVLVVCPTESTLAVIE